MIRFTRFLLLFLLCSAALGAQPLQRLFDTDDPVFRQIQNLYMLSSLAPVSTTGP